MPTLHVRNVPEDLYARLRSQARDQGRSIAAEVVHLLQRALSDESRDQRRILDEIHRRRFFRPETVGAPDSLHLLREDRSR